MDDSAEEASCFSIFAYYKDECVLVAQLCVVLLDMWPPVSLV